MNQKYSFLTGSIGVRPKHIYTQSIGRHTLFILLATISIFTLKSAILNFILALYGNIYGYVNTISLLTPPVYYKLQNALCVDE